MVSRFSGPNTSMPDPKDQIGQVARSWKMAFALGAMTTILGILVTIDPGTSLVLLAILIGVEFFLSGLFRLIRSLTDQSAHDRVLWAVVGVLLMLVGLYLIRHLHITLLLVATLVGVFWIIVGIIELTGGLMVASGGTRVWLVVTGLLGVIAGIVVLAFPVGTLLTLALLIGLWLIFRGIISMGVAWALRNEAAPPSS